MKLKSQILEKINILDAINLTILTWRINVQVSTIANHF